MQKFLRLFVMLALLFVPWVTMGQNAQVSEYDYSVSTATYSTIVGTSGASVWTAADQTAGYVDVPMQFAMYFGETQVTANSNLRVYANGSATFESVTGLEDSRLAPLYYASGYTATATSVYTKSTAQQLVVEWRKLTVNGNSYSFQMKLYPGGDIEFCYGPMTINSSLSVFTGLMSATDDVFRAMGDPTASDWNSLGRATDYATRTLSTADYPEYNTTTGQGLVYSFSQPACVKPNTLAATSIDGGATLTWDSRATSFQIKYSTDANFDPATEGTQTTATSTTKTLTGLTNFTTYYWAVRAVCSGTPSAWSEKSSFMAGTVVNMGDQTTLTTCNAMIYDDGGADGDYSASANDTLVINPATAGKRIRLVGTYYTEASYDFLYVYDGADATTAPLLATFQGQGTIDIAGDNGPLTLVFTSDGGVQYDGFAVTATCENIPTCPNPAAPEVTAEGVITWTASTNATSYDILWGTTGFNPASEGTAVNGLTTLTTTLEGLASTTTYDVYLRAHCSATNEVTEWVGPATFTTPCIGSCTHTITMSDNWGDGWEGHTIDLYVNGVFQESVTLSSGASGEATVYLCPGTTYEYRWQWNDGSQYGENNFTITDHNNDVIYTCVAEAGLSDGLVLVTGQSCFTPNCPHPSIASASDEGVITWDASTNATSYEIKYGVAGFDVETEGTLVQNLTGTTYTLTGLASSTSYDVYLRAICSATSETSDWSAAASFTTACMPMALPYTEDFESYTYSTSDYSGATALPTCWIIHSDFSLSRIPHIRRVDNNNSLELTAGTSYCIPNNIAVLPAFTQPLSNLQISFDCSRESGNSATQIFIGYVTDASDSTTFVSLTEITGVSSSFSHYEYSFAGNTIPAGARIALKVWRSGSYYWARFDNVIVEAIPTCVKPTAVEATTVTTNSATLTWTENNTATAWNVLYGPTGFDPETEGTTVNANGTATVTLSDLTGNTVYDVYVRSVCVAGVDISGWSNVYTFRTECGTLSLPYSEDFTSYTGLPSYPYNGPAITPACWNYYSNGTNTAETSGSSYYGGVVYYNYTSSYAALTAYDNYLCLPAFNCSTAASTTYQNYLAQRGNVRYAVFPQFTTAINNMLLSFDYKMSVSTATNTLYLGYITTDTSSFTVLATYPATTTIQNVVELDLSALASNAPAGARLAFKWENLTKTSNYGTTAYCGIDNIAIRQIPNCNSPINVAASDVTNSTAVITWTERTNPAATNWTLKYGTVGFDPDAEGTAVAVSTTPSYELTGLDAYTNYDVYVRAECSAVENSEWSSVCTFRTACPDGGSATIGEAGNSSTYGPALYGNYGNSYCQQIYTAEELTAAGLQAGEIAAITFTWTNNATYAKEFTIYMGQTEQSSFESTTAWVPLSEQTLVYATAPHPLNTSGTVQYDLQSSFVWDGVSNIVVTDFMNQPDGASHSNSGFYSVSTTTSPVYRCMYLRKDSSPYTTEQVSVTASGRTYLRSDITFIRPCNTSVTCFAPASVSTAITPANVVTVNWTPRTDLRPVVNNYELKYGFEGFDPETQGVLVPALNNVNTYIINADLEANRVYDVYVRTACDADNDDYSAWTKGSFTTYPTCWAPVSLTVTGTTSNSATLTWANNELAPTAATRWEVCYGLEGFGDPEYYGTKVETTNNTAFEVTGLNHSRKYDFYVRAICSATDKSDWSTVATGTTQCGVWQYSDMPLVENFDGYTGNTGGTVANHRMPNCWSYLNSGTNTTYMGLPSIYNGTTAYYKHSTPNSLRFYSPTVSTNGDQIAILPEFGFDLDTLEISFYAAINNVNAGLQVGVMSDPTDASTFEVIETVHPTTTNTQTLYEVSFSEYTGSARYVAFKVEHSTSTAQYIYMDDLTVKLREKVNTLPDNGGSVVACNEFVMPDTTGGTYPNNLNATYVLRPAQAGYVARIQGDYDLENGYDFLRLYRGTVAAANLVGTYTGTGSINEMTTSHLWADSGYFTLVFTTDADNALNNAGFKFLLTCEQPLASDDTIQDIIEANGTYTWTAGNGQTYTNHSTLEAAPDRTEDIVFPVVNVAGFDSVYRHLVLTVHPTYELNYSHVMCERDEYEFYGQTFTATGTYNVPLQSIYGADSVGVLSLQVNPAPLAMIYYNNEEVETVNNFCDNFDMALEARSNVPATYVWDDNSTDALRTVNPHESNTYTVVATNPTTGCTSLPATLTVTTTPVPALTINGDNTICYGQSATLTVTDANNVDAAYRWNTNATGTTLTVSPTETTTYSVTATTNNASACAVTAEFTVTVNPLPVVTATASVSEICRDSIVTLTASAVEGYTYEWSTGATTAIATAAAATTGAYTVTVTDQNGCVNEFNTASVTVYPSYEQDVEMSVCYINNPYTWGNMTLTEDGNYDQNYTIAHGCDSLVHLSFTFQQMGVENTYREVCEGTQVTWGSETITATENTTLTYIDNSGECPVQYNLYLTVNTHNPATVENTVCDTYTWPLNGETYTTSGAYQTMLQTTKGCDSLVTLNLTVNYQNTGIELVPTVCDSYTWDLNGQTYTEPTNEPTFTLQNEFGCDSVVTLNLAEVKHSTTGIDTIIYCAGTEYVWDRGNGRTYRLSETSGNVRYTFPSDVLTNAVGCDTTTVLNLTMNYVLDSLNWEDLTVCDEFVIDTVACDNSVATAYIRDNGDYKLRIHNATTGQDQIRRIHLTVVPSTYHTTIATECLPYTWTIMDANDQPFEIATITADMVNGASVYNMSVDLAEADYVASSCSQIEVLRLTPKYPTTEVTDQEVICQNGSWTAANSTVFYGADYVPGTHTLTWDNSTKNEAGCPLTKQVELTVNPVYSETMELTYCESVFTYDADNDKYVYTLNDENHDGQSIELTYTGELNGTPLENQTTIAAWTTVNGCDSTVNITFTVNPVTSETVTEVACYEYTWDVTNTLYDVPGTYTEEYETVNDYGCTHIITLNLTVNDTVRSYDTIPVCTSYKYNGETYRKTMTFREEVGVAKSGCDSVRYVTYEVQQNKLNEQYVYSNAPYTWANGTEYSASTEGVFYDVPVAEGCDSVLMLHFTMGEPIAFCENELPKTITIGTTSFVIPVDAVSGVWSNADAQGNDTIVAYTILRNTTKEYTVTACDSYTWLSGDSATYTQSGVYTWMTTNAAGCDSTATLTLTINNSNAETVTAVACDSYTWTTGNGETYTTSGNYVYNTTNVAGCDSVVTLALTVNVNNGVEQTEAACVEYTWAATGLTYNTSGDYTKSFTDENGCTGDSVLHLTINQPITVDTTIVVNADTASYRFNGVLYTAPYDYNTDGDIVVDTVSVLTGCDSTYTLHLMIPFVNQIDTLKVTACGTYTWARNNHLYTWISMTERQNHGYALFKDVTDNKYIYSYPVDTTFVNGAMTGIQMLVLNLMEAEYHADTLNLPLSLGTYTINGIDAEHNVTYNFAGETVEGTQFYHRDTVMEASVAYCANYVDYTVNLVNNYTIYRDTVCAEQASYTWHGDNVIGTPGHTFAYEYVENAGTLDETVDSMYLYQLPVNNTAVATVTACDSTEWNGTWYYATGTDTYTTTTARGCDSTITLNLTVNASTHAAFNAEACDTYEWVNNGNTFNYTETGDYTNNYVNAAGCASTDTLHLTINNNSNTEYTAAECNSYTWERNGETYTTSGDKTYEYTAANGCPSVDVLHLTINLPASTGYVETACDSMTWNGTKYTVSGTYYYPYTTDAGCASVDTLYLTVNNATHNSETLAQCDSYEWNGQTYTTSGDYTYDYTNAAGCASTDTLHLTINVNNSGVDTTVTACDEFTWNVNARLYNTTGTYTARTTDENGCATTNTLHLTINSTSSYDSVLYISDGSYRYTAQDGTQTFYEPGVYTVAEHYTNAAQCDSSLNITLNVGTALLKVEVATNCSEYTWRNGKTYTWLSAEERAAHAVDGQNALYYNATDQEYVYYNPTYTVPQQNSYDSVYILSLTLTQSVTTTDVVNFPISLGVLTYGDSIFDFRALDSKDFAGATEYHEVHFASNYYCDSIVDLTINLVNNYTEVATDDICVTQTEYTWRGQTISTATTDFDNAHTYYIYEVQTNADPLLTTVEYMTLTQHPVVYSTERRTACDSYTWNGTTYTESTSRATFDTIDRFGCDSTVTLMLTIKKSTDSVLTQTACESFTWNGVEYTESAEVVIDNLTNAVGCDSTATLHLTVNYNTNAEYTVDECDSYTWTAEEGGNGNTYTASDTYTYTYNTAEGCPSTNTLHLTIRNNSNQTFTETACDTYTWLAADGGNGETYTTSGVYTYDYVADNGCPSTNTLNLTVNQNSSTEYTVTDACDSMDWHGMRYVSGDYTYDYADANNCPSVDVLHLTVNNATHNSMTVVECNSYTWTEGDGNTYTVGGTYTYGYVNAAGCTSTDTLHLTIGTGRAYGIERVTNCGPYTWIVNGEEIATLDESVETSTTVTNPATGCDSTIYLYLTINPLTVTEAAICDNQTYTWTVNNTEYSEAGTYNVPVNDAEGNCLSEERLVLTVNPTEITNLTDQICLGNGYNANGFVIAASELPTAGEYTFVDHLATVNGCDSTVNLTLTVGDIINNPVEAVACDTYTWLAGDDETYTYTVSGTYNSGAYANAQGCTTVDVLTLTINNNSSTEYSEIVCDGYMWNGTQYTESGDYTYDYTDGNGCASTDVLHLTVNASTINTVEETACDSYEWTSGDGETYTASGVYTYNYTTDNGCSGTTYLVLTVNNSSSSTETATACDSYTWNGETYTESGVYTFNTTNAAGCDSTATLTLTINTSNTGVDVQTACDTYTWIDNNVYTASNNTATYTLTNAAGCDSVVTLNLTINNSVATSFADEACNAYVWEGSYYTESGAYTKTFEAANGCDSVVTLTLTVNQPVAETITETACGSYTWNGITYNASGNYTQTDVAANGCDSVTTLVLTINQPVTGAFTDEACESYTWNGETYTESGAYTQTFTAANGCDSVVTLTLTINAPANTTEDVTACESYTWHGQVYTTNGAYTYNFTDNNGCAAVATLNLTINTPANTTETVTACNSYSWNNQTYTNSGVYTSTFVDANGCNATATLSLTINNPVNATFTVTECESYTWHGQVYTVSGNYTYTTTAANGCDSIETLVLTINQPTTATEYAEACGSYTWNGTTYTQPGAYPYTTTGSNGCDSTVTLLLNLVQPVQTIINQTACDSYTWNGTTYTTSGSYSVTFTAANNCDSVVTLNLTVNNSVSNSLTATACESYTWNGQTYATSGSYTQVFTAHNGCDSTVTLALTINTPTTATVTETACSSFDWNGETYTTSGSYTYTTTGANGCDSVTTLLLTINLPVYTNLEANAEGSYSWNGETYTESGVYTYTTTAANGCDSVVTLTLTITPVYTVTLESQNEAWGSVSESGTIAENGYFTATATANEGYEFVAWLNGNDTVSTSSTYIFQVTEDITLTAVFAEVQGISAVDMNNVVIYSTDSRIFVNGAEGYDVYVYDVNGRVINRQMKAADAIEFRMTTTGVYLVKVGNAPAKRVVVVR